MVNGNVPLEITFDRSIVSRAAILAREFGSGSP